MGAQIPSPHHVPCSFSSLSPGGPLLCHLPGLLLLPCSPRLPALPCTPSGCLCSRTGHRVEDQLITLSLAALVGKAGSLMCVLQRPRSWTSYRLASEDRAWLECSCGMQACRPAPPPPPPRSSSSSGCFILLQECEVREDQACCIAPLLLPSTPKPDP